jgi:tRNA/rRNA methyltransferase
LKKINPTIILVRPQLYENIGMTARAMDNFNLSKLSIVNPRDGWPSKKAEASSKHAKKIIYKAKIYNSLEDAISNHDLVIATSNRQRFLTKKTYDNFDIFKKKINDYKNIAILFGPENSGLSNKDLRLSSFIFKIPTSNKNKSLNLSHAVTIISHELFSLSQIKIKKVVSNLKNEKANKGDLSNFMDFLINDLNLKGFFKPVEKKESMIDNIYSIYNKIDLSKKELRMLWGIHKKLKNQPKS